MPYSLSGSSVLVYEYTSDGLILNGTMTTTGATPPTTADIFAAGAEIINLDDGIKYRNGGTSASPSWQNADQISTSEIADAAVTPVKYNIVEARTATTDGTTTGTISATTTHVTVTSDDANKIIILPAPVAGRQIVIHGGATGFELRSSTPASIAINGGSGSNAESAIAANSTCFLTCVSTTAWKGYFMDADGDLAKIEAAA